MAGNVVSNVKKYYGGQIPTPGQGDSDGKVKVLVEKAATIEIDGVQTEVGLLYDSDDLTTPVTPQQLGQWTDQNYLIAFKKREDDGRVRGFVLYALGTDSTSTDTLVNRAEFIAFKEDMTGDPGASAYEFTMVEDSSTLTRYLRDVNGEMVVKFNKATVEAGAQSDTLDNLLATDVEALYFEVVHDGDNAYLVLNTQGLGEIIDDIHSDLEFIIDALDELPSDEHGYFNSSLYTTPGDGTTTNLVMDNFRISENRDVHGDSIEFVPTRQEGGVDFGEVYLEPGTYILAIQYTLQWVGNPRGTFLPLVANVADQPFDFSYEHEDIVRVTRIVTRTTRGKLVTNIPIDADTPPMGVWVKNLEVVQITSYSHPPVYHDTTLTGTGVTDNPLGVTPAAFGQVKYIPTSISQFRTGDVIPVDGPNGPAKMPKDDLLSRTAQAAFEYVKSQLYFATSQALTNETTRATWRENEIEALFSAPTEEAVAAWLEAHPEATTTVQDHSLTHQKLVNGTLNFVTPEMYGAVGDGVTDDTAAIQQAVNSGYIVVFANKTYRVSAPSPFESAITLNDDKILLLNNATIKLVPNAFEGYRVILARGINNKIIGGHIIGDYDEHEGSTGQWGHGIQVTSQNVLVRGCEVENCWGDGIVVSGGASKVLVENCHVHNNRRQGFTIGYSNTVKIKDCLIHDIGGTDPGAAIDIEPNANETASNIVIDGCEEYNNVRGFEVFQNDATVTLSGITFINCKSGTSFRCQGADHVSVQNCVLNGVSVNQGTTKFEAVNCKLSFVNASRSTESAFKQCDIECNTARNDVIHFYVDGPAGGMASVGFYDCNISTTSTSLIFDGGASKDLVDELVISNCKITNKSDGRVNFMGYLPKKLFIENSSITGFMGAYGNFFVSNQDVIVRINNSVLDMGGSVTLFYSYTANADIVIMNTEISNVSRFFRVAADSTVTGITKLIANIMSSTSLSNYDYTAASGGSESLVKLTLPSMFTNLQ